MKNFKYFRVERNGSSTPISFHCFQATNEHQIIKQAQKMTIQQRQIDKELKFNQIIKLSSSLGEWYLTKDQHFSYSLLCSIKVSPQYGKTYLDQIKVNLASAKANIINQNTEIKAIINSKISEITLKYEEKIYLMTESKILTLEENYSSQHLNCSQEIQQVKVKSQLEIPTKSQKSLNNSKENVNSKSERSNEEIIEANKMTTKDKICIVGVTIFAMLILIALAIVLPLTIKPGSKSDPCDPYRTLCQGVSQQTKDYIFTNYKNPNDIQALLQAAQKLQSGNYQDILKSMVCLTYVMGNNAAQGFGNVRDITLNTLQKMKAYLTTAAQSSTTTSQNSVSSSESCQFTVTAQIVSSENNLNKRLLADTCSSDSDLIYIDSIPGSPYRMASNINSIKNLIQSDPDITFSKFQYYPPFQAPSNLYTNFISDLNITLTQAGYTLTQEQIANLIVNLIDSTSSNVLVTIPNLEKIVNVTVLPFLQLVFSVLTSNSQLSIFTTAQQIVTKINSGKIIVLIGHTLSCYHQYVLYIGNQNYYKDIALLFIAPAFPFVVSAVNPNSPQNYFSNPSDQILGLIKQNGGMPQAQNTLPTSFTGVGGLCLNNCLQGYINAFPSGILTQLKAQKAQACLPNTPD